jgi:hypothetical protein
VSPEIKEMIRAFAYNPMSSNVASTGQPFTDAAGLGLPDAVREDIFRSAGTQELWGVRITDLLELGNGQKYNKLFGVSAPAGIAHDAITGNAQGGTWNDSDDQLIIGLDASRDAFIRPVAQQHDSGGSFSVLPDDQFVARADKTGFYGFLEEGRVCIDSKAIVGLVV